MQFGENYNPFPGSLRIPAEGPSPAEVLIVGEVPGQEEEKHFRPFFGASGSELTKMLNEAGILRTECRVTNVCPYRPPNNNIDFWWPQKKKDYRSDFIPLRGRPVDRRVLFGFYELILEIERTKPNVIVPMGNLSLWALTGNVGITKWRSSLLQIDTDEMRAQLPKGFSLSTVFTSTSTSISTGDFS